MTKNALICGISGQDGALLAKLLLDKGYRVFGTSRDAEVSRFSNLVQLGLLDKVTTLSMTLTDFRSVLQVLSETKPDEIYNLAGQSSVGLSFAQPVETLESIAFGTLNLLEVLRFLGGDTRLYNAASSECFGETAEARPATEESPFHPRSPYGVAKATAFWEVANYREAYGLFASSGILFNHESPLRPERFVTRKVVRAAARIAAGSGERLKLGALNVVRDWGWAEDYVDAMWRMLQLDHPTDFVVATGKSHSLEYFVQRCFELKDLDWRDHVEVDQNLMRATDIATSHGNPGKAERLLGWRSTVDFDELLRRLIAAERITATA
ncbi:GDP-mannose 4,6-dehydratase [Sphingomonas sp. ERG5]|uniref:GDP-mannose 4,6-dehydratase n=1 Tax=Sphingomonas sp. ERG5 TaxID=1381597 RepID=UPI00054B0AB3|nr:GDP-mannose 4,6-dehydratase [Sphingomonas sp. ERG5]